MRELRAKIRRSADVILIVTLAAELLFYIYVNLFKLSYIVDVDFARVLRHVTEIADRRTVFLPYWDYITTAELDHSALFAIPLYMITGNVILSYGIANLINLAVWSFVIFMLLERMGLPRRYRLLFAVMLLTIYDLGMLAYSNMLFIGAVHYSYKVLLPLTFISLLIIPAEERRRPSSIILMIIYFAFLFVTGISSGIYVFICGILPVIACMIISPMISGRISDVIYKAVLSIASAAVTVSGIIICRINHVTPNSELASIKDMTTIRSNLFSTFLDLCEAYRIFPEKSTPVMSLGAVMSIIRLGLFVLILLFGISSVSSYGKKEAADTSQASDAYAYRGEQFLISVFLWNYFILFVSGSQPRYHLMGAVPLMLCTVIGLLRWSGEDKDISDLSDEADGVRTLVFAGIVAALFILNMYQILWGFKQYCHREDYSRAVDAAVIAFMDENDVNTAFAIGESGYGMEWLRAADKSRSYETYVPQTGEVINYDFYYSGRDRSAYEDRNVIIATEQEFDLIPDHIKSGYELKGEAYDYGLYISQNDPIDGIAGMISGMNTVDLVTAPGYEVKGDIDQAGYLITSDTGEVMISPDLVITGGCKWTIAYEAQPDTDAYVTVYDHGDLVIRMELSDIGNELAIELPSSDSLKIVTDKQGNGVLKIKDMRFITGDK